MSADHRHRIAVIAGDGIGREVIPAGLAVLEAATRSGGVRLETTDFPWGCDYYRRTGRMLDADGPINVRPLSAQASAKPGFSERNP